MGFARGRQGDGGGVPPSAFSRFWKIRGRENNSHKVDDRTRCPGRSPKQDRSGIVGKQDINDEWIYPDPKLPLLIHDSNGMDVKGPERVDTIRKFLDEHQNSNDMSERIHIVWYVIRAIDRRFLDDGNVLNLVCSYNILFVLIVTNNDVIIPKDKEIITEELLDKLLVDVLDMASMKKNMVRGTMCMKRMAN